MSTLLPKKAYVKLTNRLKVIKTNWEADRVEYPSRVPYDVESSVRTAIETCAREEHVQCHGNANWKYFIDNVIKYLVEKKLLFPCPYGGYYPAEAPAGLPSKEQFIADTMKEVAKIFKE